MIMKCLICKQGITQPGTTTVTLESDCLTMIIKCVPAEVCRNCGEAYVDEHAAIELLISAERSAQAGAQVEIRQYSAASI
jgi:YgiT-type zinc finger domain-containing protein